MPLPISLPRIQIAPGSPLSIPDISWTDFTRSIATAYHIGTRQMLAELKAQLQ